VGEKSLAQLFFEAYAPREGFEHHWNLLSSPAQTHWIRVAGLRLSKRARETYASEYARQLISGKLPPWALQSESFRVRWIDGARQQLREELTPQEETCSER
jgi:hypothetical protein